MILRKYFLIVLVILISGGVTAGNEMVGAQSGCGSVFQSTYSLTVCINAPAEGVLLSSAVTVEATVSSTGRSPGVQKLIFHLDDQYLITDYAAPYVFTLTTDHFVDGLHRLSVQADIRNTFLTDTLAAVILNFSNGVTAPPVNTREFTPHVPAIAPGMPQVVIATGDGASGETPEVTDLIASLEPDMFLYLGDVYENGTYTEFYNWYGASGTFFSAFKRITNPTIGNHEYEPGLVPAYYEYWDNVPDYYSFDAGGWHFISLNSTSQFNQRRPGTAQFQWLQQERAARTKNCTLAYWHHPRFSVGEQGDTPALDNIWQLLAATNTDVVLTGHDHNYQRWVPLDANGRPSEEGIIQFVLGAGGHGISHFVRHDARVAAGFDSSPEPFGVLRLEMYPDWLQFEYVDIEGKILDSGIIECYGDPV